MNACTLIKYIAQQLNTAYDNTTVSEQHAWWLLEKVIQKDKTHLLTEQSFILTPQQSALLESYLYTLVVEHMPIAYLLGSVPFCDSTILVEPPILIPRPETEEWVYNLIQRIQTLDNQAITILDMCTGSGCIAIALAQAFPLATVYAVDISHAALNLAQKNAAFNNVGNVHCIESDLFNAIPSQLRFDFIVSNPPYIPAQEWNNLMPSVKLWEDPGALIAQENGMKIITSIINAAPHFLKNNTQIQSLSIAQLVIEIDHTQGALVHNALHNKGFTSIDIVKDYAGNDRIAQACLYNPLT